MTKIRFDIMRITLKGLFLFVMVIMQNHMEILGSCPQRITISSTGPAKNWEETSGNYKLLRYDDNNNAVYEHEDHEGHYLSKPKGILNWVQNKLVWEHKFWIAGNEIGSDFGLIGNTNCENSCPTNCKPKTWKYFIDGKNGGSRRFEYDHKLTVEEATIDGNWSSWSEWTKCSATCKGGRKSRSRVCDSPPPSGGGKNCSGSSSEIKICNTKSCTPPDLEKAEIACRGFGEDWKISRKTQGSLVCSTVAHYKNCQSCDSWRLLVWENGFCDRLVVSKCRFNTTRSGNFYCGYEPCKNGDLKYGGKWFQ